MTTTNTTENITARALATMGSDLTIARIRALGGYAALIASSATVRLTEGETAAVMANLERAVGTAPGASWYMHH